MMIKTRYEALQILGLSVSAGKEEYKSAYRNIIKKCHPDNLGPDATDEIKEKAAYYCQCAKEAFDFLEAEQAVTIDYSQNYSQSYSDSYSKSRIIGSPVNDKMNKSNKDRANADVKKQKEQIQSSRQKRYRELQEKGREIRIKEKEKQILDEIRWIRVAQIIQDAIKNDGNRQEKEDKLAEAIRKARENSED